MNVPSLALGFSLVACLAWAQGSSGVAVTPGAGPKSTAEVMAGAGLPPGVRSEAISATNTDAKAVRLILDSNSMTMATMFKKGPYDYANFYRGWYCSHQRAGGAETDE